MEIYGKLDAASQMKQLCRLNAIHAAHGIWDGKFKSEDLVQSCLEQIRSMEDSVRAWAFLDQDYALEQARNADGLYRAGRPLAPLHGIPVGIKDIIDTADMPTENGTVLHAGRVPTSDATLVTRLRNAGALIMGKTVSTELATYSPGKTRNPRNLKHTPGGSSSGSAAAVAANMVPLAIGTQTNGSVIRPAAYCGVFGFKPSHGLISRSGVLKQSRWLDQIGVFARSVDDIALVVEQIQGFDGRDPDTRSIANPRLLSGLRSSSSRCPRLSFIKSPVWPKAEQETQAVFVDLITQMEGLIESRTLPSDFDEAIAIHRTIMEADIALNFRHDYEQSAEYLTESLRQQIARGRKISAFDYNSALSKIPRLNHIIEDLFDEGFDAILTPAATGTAPKGLDFTGDPSFCTLWTLCGLPSITLPFMQGANGLPIGIQLVGRRGDDARLLRTTSWLVEKLSC